MPDRFATLLYCRLFLAEVLLPLLIHTPLVPFSVARATHVRGDDLTIGFAMNCNVRGRMHRLWRLRLLGLGHDRQPQANANFGYK